MKKPQRGLLGFSLIEVMIVIGIIGILAALALPALRVFVVRSKTSEATGNLNAMFKGAAAYYTGERTKQSLVASTAGSCTVDAGCNTEPATPSNQKVKMIASDNLRAIGFHVADYVFYRYCITAEPALSACGRPASTPAVYTMEAFGDLDFDTTWSTFELAVGSNAENELYHARGFYINRETE